MAPAAANSHEIIWADEMENVDLELAASSSSGGSSLAAPEDNDRGWQTVIYPKKRRQAKLKNGIHEEDGDSGVVGADYDESPQVERNNSKRDVPKVNHQKSSEDEQDQQPKKSKRTKKPKVSLAHAAAGISPADLQSQFGELSEIPPENQLARCTEIFKAAFTNVAGGHFFWESTSKDSLAKSVEKPLHDIPDAVCKITSEFLGKLPVDALSGYVLGALTELLEINRHRNAPPISNKSKAAFSVVLALVLRRKPEALLLCAERLRSSMFQGPQKLYALAWAYGQVAKGDSVCGMAIWTQNLLPLAVGNSSTPVSRDIALQFIESLGSDPKFWATVRTSPTRKGERLVHPAAMISLMYMAYPASRTKATDRFLAVYPLVKDIALAGPIGSKSMKPVAQQLLPMSLTAAAEDVPLLSAEACRLFQWCLVQSQDSYKEWERIHMDRLKGSTRAMAYLLNDWKETTSLLSPMTALKDTVKSLRIKHAEIEEENLRDAVKEAEAQCVYLQRKMSSIRMTGCLTTGATLVGVALMCVSYYGVNSWTLDRKTM